MGSYINGEQEDPKKDAQEAANKAMQGLVNYFFSHLMVIMRGCVIMTSGLKPEMLLMAACHAFGNVIGSIYGGTEEEVKKLREACRVAFSSSLHQTPVTPVSKQAEQPIPAQETAVSAQAMTGEAA